MCGLLVKAGENVNASRYCSQQLSFRIPSDVHQEEWLKDVRQVHRVSTQPQRRVKLCRLQDLIQMHRITLGNSQKIKKNMLF